MMQAQPKNNDMTIMGCTGRIKTAIDEVLEDPVKW